MSLGAPKRPRKHWPRRFGEPTPRGFSSAGLSRRMQFGSGRKRRRGRPQPRRFQADRALPDLTPARDAPRAIGPIALAFALVARVKSFVGRTGRVRGGMDRGKSFPNERWTGTAD